MYHTFSIFISVLFYRYVGTCVRWVRGDRSEKQHSAVCHILVFVFISLRQIGSTCFSSRTYCDHSVCVLFILNVWLRLILRTAWRYQRVIRISKSKDRQHNGQKRGHMFAHSGGQHNCVVTLFCLSSSCPLVYPMLPVSLDYTFFIALFGIL